MKLNRLEAHDRKKEFQKDQAFNISQGAEDCLKKNPDSLRYQSKSPYVYLFAHPRTHENGYQKVMYWQPRLTRPTPEANSYLFRAQSNTDIIEVCWLIPPSEMWSQYKTGNVTQDETMGQLILWSIDQFKNNRAQLAASLKDDLSDEQCKNIMVSIMQEKRQDDLRNRLYTKPEILAPYSS